METDRPDLVDILEEAAASPGEVTPEGMAFLLREAAEMIRTLRVLVGIREEIELEDIEPKGRA